MKLKDFIKRRNADSSIYLSDVHEWIGKDKPTKLAVEIKAKLDEEINVQRRAI